MTHKEEQLSLLALVAWVMGWGLWAVSLDSSVTSDDAVFGGACRLYRILSQGAWGELWPWLHHADFHPPLPYLVAGLIAAPLGIGVAGVRMSMVVLHAVAVLQVHRLGRTVTDDRSTAVLAALLAATTPVIAGWFRLDYQEPITTVLVLATLQVALTTDLHHQRRRTLLLGLLVGLGALSKLSYPAVMLLPALVFLATRVKTARAALNVLLALVVCLVVCSWWYREHLGFIVQNWHMSTSTQSGGLRAKLLGYFVAPVGNTSLTVAAAAGFALAWRDRVIERGPLLLLTSTWGLGYAAFLLLFDFWGRYILVLLPISALFAAVAVVAAVRRLPLRWRWTGGIAVATVIVGLSASATLLHDPENRDTGLLVPDRRDRSAISRALDLLASRKARAIWAVDSDEAYHELSARLEVERIKPRRFPTWIDRSEAQDRTATGDEVHALIITTGPGHGHRGVVWNTDARESWTWTGTRRRLLIKRFVDAMPYSVGVYRLKGMNEASDRRID